MKKPILSLIPLLMVLVAMITPLGISALGNGIPEPSMILYGVLRESNNPTSARITSGRLIWEFESLTDGSTFSISTDLADINRQYSYVLQVPCESPLPGQPISANTLTLGTDYNRSRVILETGGSNTVVFVSSEKQVLTLGATDRGHLEQVDLALSVSPTDTDKDGMPDQWEMDNFGHPTAAEPDHDPDGDGMTNLDEYVAGTNPNSAESVFHVNISLDEHGEGMLIQWSSVSDRVYTVYRSEDVLTGYEPIAGGLMATPPINTYVDMDANQVPHFFYRVKAGE